MGRHSVSVRVKIFFKSSRHLPLLLVGLQLGKTLSSSSFFVFAGKDPATPLQVPLRRFCALTPCLCTHEGWSVGAQGVRVGKRSRSHL